MDIIITAIVIGFCVWIPFKLLNMFLKNYAHFKKLEMLAIYKKSTVVVRIEEIKQENAEDLILVFNSDTGKFITQGSITDITHFIKNQFKSKTVFLAAGDGSDITLLKPAE